MKENVTGQGNYRYTLYSFPGEVGFAYLDADISV
jgi:hypothetical protein